MMYNIPTYSVLEIALTPPERIYSEDMKHRIWWNGKFLRNFKTEEACKNALSWFSSFLNAENSKLEYIKGD